MKKPIFLILIGVGVVLLVVGVAFVVPWFGRMMTEMDQISTQHAELKRELRAAAREPLDEEQEKLLSQLLRVSQEMETPQGPSDLEAVLSSEPYLSYLKTQVGQDYADFSAYVDTMPTEDMKAVALSRIEAVLGTDKSDEELQIWQNYYFVVREWGTTVLNPRDNLTELNKLQQTHLIEPLMENNPEDLSSKILQIGLSSMFMTEDNNVFQDVWRERLETHGEQEGLLRCAVASPDEFALMRSFFPNINAFQTWILTRPEPEN